MTLLTLLFVVALAGRFSFERAGLPTYGVDDLRIVAYGVLLLAALLWHLPRATRGGGGRWPRVFGLFSVLIALLMTSALWAPDGARLQKASWDLLLLWVLVLSTALLATGDPQRAARVFLVLMLAAGTVYAVAAVATGPQEQGRYAAFGGGPNIFVRVVSLGLIASIALASISRRRALLLPLPLLAAAAVLSGSRGGLVSLIGAGTLFFILFARRRMAMLVGSLIVGGLGSWAVWSLVGAWFATVAANRYSTTGLQRGDFSARPELLSEAWRIFLDHPVAGAGLDAFYTQVGMGYPHNYFAQVAAESGLLGMLLLLCAVAAIWRDGGRWSTRPREQVACAVGSIYILLTSMFSGDHFDTRFCWILAVIAVLRPGVTSDHPRHAQEITRWQTTKRRSDVGGYSS